VKEGKGEGLEDFFANSFFQVGGIGTKSQTLSDTQIFLGCEGIFFKKTL
jgi:hypothetical protein